MSDPDNDVLFNAFLPLIFSNVFSSVEDKVFFDCLINVCSRQKFAQDFKYHTRNPDTGINLYSFALRPEEHQPSGTCNFSRIDNATLQLVLSNATVEGTKTAKVRVYATNYNVLRVMSGTGGLAYSN